MNLERGDPVALTRELVRIDSRNPSLVSGAPGEGDCARALGDVLRAWGMQVELHDVAPGRPNVVARAGRGAGPSLVLNGHLDTVGVEGMRHAPFGAEESNEPGGRDRRGGRLYGRGASDMKGGVAAMCAAATRVAAGSALAGEVIVTAVVDEEYQSIGTRALVERGLRADAAIVTEPTRLAIMPAHRGFAWIEVALRGRAAHGSRYDIGVDAIRHAGLLLTELDVFEGTELIARAHPLLGHASLHAATIEGGVGWSTYPDRCTLRIERRTLPGESAEQALGEVRTACERVRALHASFEADVTLAFAQSPSDVPADAPVVRALADAARRELGEVARLEGMSAWTDAAILNSAGIPAICFGPGDISLAHAAEEWVDVTELERATAVLERLIRSWCADGGRPWRS